MDNQFSYDREQAFFTTAEGSRHSRFLSEWTSGEVGEFDFGKTPIVISTAAVEQHGTHTMPIGTDHLIAEGLTRHTVQAMADDDPGVFLPIVPFGYSPEHSHFPGTCTLKPETYLALLYDLAGSLKNIGATRILIANYHGGNPPLNQVACMEIKNRFGIIAGEYNYARNQRKAMELHGEEETFYGYHAGAAEYALGLFLFPEKLKEEGRGNFPSSFPSLDASFRTLRVGSGFSSIAWHTENAHPTGAIGNSTIADAAQGKLMAEEVSADLIGALHDLNSPQLDEWLDC